MRFALLFGVLLTIATGIGNIWDPSVHGQKLVHFFNTHKPVKMVFARPDLNSNIPGFTSGLPVTKRPIITPQWG